MVKTMKLDEMRNGNIVELQESILNLKKKLLGLRIAKAMHKLEDTSQVVKTKKLIAQIKTIIKEKQLAIR